MREQVAALVLRSSVPGDLQCAGEYRPFRPASEATTPTSPRPSAAIPTSLVHRLLIHHLGLAGEESGEDYEPERVAAIGEQVSATERKAVDAERRAHARYVALFMEDRQGSRFMGQVTSVQRFGLFITLNDTGAEGLVPVSTLGDDMFLHDERHHALVGERYGETFAMGDAVTVTLKEVDTAKGMLLFQLDEHEPGAVAERARAAWRKGGKPRQRMQHRHRGQAGHRHHRGRRG